MLIFILFMLVGVLTMLMWSFSFINLLISLELMMFSLYLGLLFFYSSDSLMMEILIFMILGVCEGVLGLVILLMKVNFSGKDYMINNLNF